MLFVAEENCIYTIHTIIVTLDMDLTSKKKRLNLFGVRQPLILKYRHIYLYLYV